MAKDVSTTARSMAVPVKLREPPLCRDYVARPRLLERLERGQGGGLTLVAAPAGFGKTTLLSAWLDATPRLAAWLALDERDSELSGFVRDFVAAIQTIFPDFGQTTLGLLLQPEPPPAAYLADDLARELADLPDELGLVLDDYHVIDDPTVHTLMESLALHLPSNVQLVLSTRQDPPLPLPLLRARGNLVEVRGDDLRFRSYEAREFLTGALGERVADNVETALTARTEGWAAALRLAALALLDQPDRAGWVRAFKQSSHPFVHEFIVDEVLASQPLEVQDFVFSTAPLERFCGPLRDALLDVPPAPGSGQRILEELDHRQLFLVPLDAERGWYRYHHLFRDALRQRLPSHYDAPTVAIMHRRASAWLATQGLLDEAVDHALAGGDVEQAAELVERSIEPALEKGDWPAIERRLRRLPAGVVERRPRLLVAQVWLLNFRFRFKAMPALIDRLEKVLEQNEQGLASDETQALRAEGDTARAIALVLEGDGRPVMDLARPAYERLPAHRAFARAQCRAVTGCAHHLLGDTAAGLALLEAACAEALDRDDTGARQALWAMNFIHTASGDARSAEQAARRMLAASPENLVPLSNAWAHYFLGHACYELNELTEAQEHFLAVDRLRHQAHVAALRNSLLELALTEQALGNAETAWATTDALAEFSAKALRGRDQGVILTCQARLALYVGDLETANAHLGSLRTDLPIGVENLEGGPRLTRARLLIALGGAAGLGEAGRLLDELEAAFTSVNHSLGGIGTQAVRALLHQARGESVTALEVVGQAVARARRGGLVRTLVDLGPPMQRLLVELARRTLPSDRYLDDLLAAFPATSGPVEAAAPSRGQAHPDLVEALTWRELEILHLLDARLSNKEIGVALSISSETVKKHSSNIYQKLAVGSRREAVSRAHALGLLRPPELAEAKTA